MLKRSIMFIVVLLLLFVGLAMPASAGGVGEWDGPYVEGIYAVKCNIKFYDWTCNKVLVIKEAEWQIAQSLDSPKIKCMFILKGIPEEWTSEPELDLYSPNGYVGPYVRKSIEPDSRIKNKPRLSQWGDTQEDLWGQFCLYSEDPENGHYGTWVINAKVKVDSKTGDIKYIKGRIDGWGEWGPVWGTYPGPTGAPGEPPLSSIPTLGQFEGKFKATYAGPLPP